MLSQEIETFYLLPAIRKKVVQVMIEKKIKKKKIGELLNLTKSAISQYVSNKRVKNFKIDNEVVLECCENIVKGKSYISEFQKLINDLKKTGKICLLYKKNGLKPEDCKVCSMVTNLEKK